MGQSAVTKERLAAARQMLIHAALSGEFDRESTTPEQTGGEPPIVAAPNGGGGGILELAVTPETLLKLVNSNTKELVITIKERI